MQDFVSQFRNLAFGEDSHALPLTSELDALCGGECEPDPAAPVARGDKKDASSKRNNTGRFQAFFGFLHLLERWNPFLSSAILAAKEE